jgi:flagellar protein FlaF
MYQFTYAEVVDDSPQDMRERERDALARCINMLEAAEQAGPQSAEELRRKMGDAVRKAA